MSQPKPPSAREQAEQRLQEEALRVAKSAQTPGQTKEQTKLIAKGIEKGIAFYKQQQKAKARELDKARKKALKQRPAETDLEQEEPLPDYALESSPAKPALFVAGLVFALAALLHGLRYFLGWRVAVGSFEIPPSWSLAAVFVAGALAVWMFRAGRD
jgi:hypothetical protein